MRIVTLMDSIVALVEDLATRDLPMLTSYGPDGERVDLTGKTAANWIVKATNLLSLELAAEPGSTVWLDLPLHWRSLIWAHATWCTGAEVVNGGADISITASPTSNHEGSDLVVIALPALARRVDDLPPDAIDGAADLMTQGDSFVLPPEGGATDPTGIGASQGDLLSRKADYGTEVAQHSAPRLLLIGDDLRQGLTLVASAWALGMSVVLAPDESVVDAEAVTHVKHLQ